MYVLDSSRTRKIQFIIVWNVYSSLLVFTVFILKYIYIYNLYLYYIFIYQTHPQIVRPTTKRYRLQTVLLLDLISILSNILISQYT